MGDKRRLGIYGGTFSPPHLGHLRALRAFVSEVLPDELLIIPAYTPPHKSLDGGADAIDRLNMCRLAFSDIEGAVVSDMEIKRGGKSYTVDTLRELKREDNELYFLMGTDMFITLDKWYKPEEICSLATICVARREDDPFCKEEIEKKLKEYKKAFDIRVRLINYIPLELSSSQVRDMIKSGESLSSFLDKGVIDYIGKEGIYL